MGEISTLTVLQLVVLAITARIALSHVETVWKATRVTLNPGHVLTTVVRAGREARAKQVRNMDKKTNILK